MTVPSRSASPASAPPLRRATALLVAVALLGAGCRSPVAFYRPGHGPSDAPVLALGAPAPFVRTPPDAPPADGPMQDAAGVYAGTTGPSALAESLRHLPQRLYIPDSLTGGVTVLDAGSLRPVGSLRPSPPGPVQLTAAPDLHELWLNDTTHGAVVPLPPTIGRAGRLPTLPTPDPTEPASPSPSPKPRPREDVTSGPGPAPSPSLRPRPRRAGGMHGTGGRDADKRGSNRRPRGVRPSVTHQGADTRTPNSADPRPRPSGRDPGPSDQEPSRGRTDDGLLGGLLGASARVGASPVLLGTAVRRGLVAAPAVLGTGVDASVLAFTRRLPVPGTLYFAPDDSQAALVVSARGRQVDVRSARTGGWTAIPLPCAGSAADFSADASMLAVSCAEARRIVLLDRRRGLVDATRVLPEGARPSAVRLLPDGSRFAVADAGAGGVWLLDARDLRNARFVRTSAGASALVLSRDARSLYVAGTSEVTVLDVGSRRVAAHWRVSGDGALAAGGVSVDGRTLWLTRPSTGTLIALGTRTGVAERSVHLGGHPAAPLPFPQPGRHSLGGPGIYR
ncbi:hypothetical protein [Actinomadura oligospora]|uniref:hypothetical protein n=1 Tax=Actinomadura oligospora TaxID=111804 RepID=UPI0004B56012|nr:hypothetical protein [Actinomadura oligospora]